MPLPHKSSRHGACLCVRKIYLYFTRHRESGGWFWSNKEPAVLVFILVSSLTREKVLHKQLLTETLWLSVPPYIRKFLVSIIDRKFANPKLSPFYAHLLLLGKFVDAV